MLAKDYYFVVLTLGGKNNVQGHLLLKLLGQEYF